MTGHALRHATSFDDVKGPTFLPRIARHWLARRAVAKLDRYDDHLLRDIGVSRADLRWAMRLPLTVDSTTALRERVNRME